MILIWKKPNAWPISWTGLTALTALVVVLLPLAMGEDYLSSGASGSQHRDFFTPLVLLVIALTYWAAGVFVRFRKPDDALAGRLYWLSLVMAGAIGLAVPIGHHALWQWDWPIEVLCYAFLPGLFLSVCLWLVSDSPPIGGSEVLVRWLVAGGVGAAGFYLVSSYLMGRENEAGSSLLLALLTVGFLSGLAALVRGWRECQPGQSKQQIQVVLTGMAVAVLPLLLLSVIPTVIAHHPVVDPYIAVLSSVSLPLSLAYAVLRYQFLDIRIVIQRTLVYALMTVLLAGCYALFLYGLDLAGVGRNAVPPLLVVGFFAALTLTFAPLQLRIRNAVDRLIFRDRYDYARTLRYLGERLASLQPLDKVLGTVTERLAAAMNLEGVAVLLRQPDGTLTVQAASGAYRHLETAQLSCPAELPQPLVNVDVPSFSHCFPLEAHGETSGYLCLGPKQPPSQYRDEDLHLVHTVASQAAVAFANALLIQRLRGKVDELELLRDRLLSVEEESHKRVARDLHDGALHTALELVRQAEAASRGALTGVARDSFRDRFHALAELGRDVADEVRTVCSDLYPAGLTDLGLVPTLEGLAETVSRDENLLVRFSHSTFPDELCLPQGVEEGLYRVVQEAVNNIVRHAGASAAFIELALDREALTVEIRDDGHGFEVPTTHGSLLRRGHLGLVSMQERIERLGGKLEVRSRPGLGTTVCAHLWALEGVREDAPVLLELDR